MPDRVIALIVNFNRRDLLWRTITSLRDQTRRPDLILVIDNGSADDSVASVRARAEADLRVIAMGENLGSSGGFCRGITESLAVGATHLLILDSDVTLANDTLAQLRAALDREPQLGVVGPKVYHWDSTTVLQELGGWIDWDIADLRRSHWRHDEAVAGVVIAGHEVDYVPACCLLTTRDTVEAAGNFDPGWFLYWDDIDWCDRVRATGRKIAIAPAARVQHFGGGANKCNLVPVYYGWRNRLVFFQRRTPTARRESSLRAFFEDYLLARFTCRALGLPKLAAVMQLAVDDALAGGFGVKDFAGVDLALDPPVAVPVAAGGVEKRVHHVVGSATAEMAAEPAVTLVDRFGKKLPASQAWALRQQFESERAAEVDGLLRRAV